MQCVKTVVALFSREEFFLKLVLSFLGTGRTDGRRRRARTRRDARGAARPRPRPRRRDRSTRADTPAGTTRGDEGGGTSSTVPSAARRNERRRFASRVALVGFFRSLRQLSTTVSGRIQRNPQADPQPFSPPKSSIKISQTLAFWRDRARFNWPFEGKSASASGVREKCRTRSADETETRCLDSRRARFSRPCALMSRYLSGKNHAPRRTFADARASGRRQRVRPTRGRRHNPPRRRGRDPESIPAIDRARAGTGTGMREIGKIDGGAIAVACAPDDLACDEVSLELDSPRSAIAVMQPPSERARPRSARRRSVDAARPELTRFSARRARARGSANDASNNPRNAIGSVSVDTGLCLMDARDDDPTSPKIGNSEMGYAQLMPLVLHALSRLRCVPARVPAACLQPSALPRFSCYFFFPSPTLFFAARPPLPPAS